MMPEEITSDGNEDILQQEEGAEPDRVVDMEEEDD
jgi:hypothetical protein